MVKIKEATCEICGAKFEGSFCVERAEEHELIPVTDAKFEIGNFILTLPKRMASINISIVEKIELDSEHKPHYDDGCHTEEYGMVLKPDVNNVISESDLLHSPDYEVLRKRILFLGIRSILHEIEQRPLDIRIERDEQI